jgi:hypothetical protein
MTGNKKSKKGIKMSASLTFSSLANAAQITFETYNKITNG